MKRKINYGKTPEKKRRKIVFIILGIIFAFVEASIIALLSYNTKIGRNIFFIIAILYVYYCILKYPLQLIQFILSKFKLIDYKSKELGYKSDNVEENLNSKLNIQYQKEVDIYIARIVWGIVFSIILFICCLCGNVGIVSAIIMTFFAAIVPTIYLLAKDPTEYFVGYKPEFNTNSNTNNSNEKKEHIKFKRSYIKDAFGNITGTADTVSFSDELGGFETTEYKDNSGKTTGKIEKY